MSNAGRGAGGTAGSARTSAVGEAGASGSPDLDRVPSAVDLVGSPLYTRVERLTNSQWEHAVTDILGFGTPQGLSASFPPPSPGLSDFDNNEKVLFVSREEALAFESAAEAAAALATASPDALARVYPGVDPEGFVATLGRRVFRRPLTAAEQARYEDVFALGETLYGTGFANGAALVVRALLEAPYFLYRTELGASGEPLNGYEVASKLSFWLLDTTPSDELLDAAAAGELDDADGLEAVARQMLEQPAAAEVLRSFHRQLYRTDLYRSVTKTDVPEFTDAVDSELEASATAFFDRIFSEGHGLREILTARVGFVGPGLAALYGSAPPASGLELRELGASRSGYFMQIPFLLLQGFNRVPNAYGRGAALHRQVLCATFPEPSPEVPPPTAPEPDQTNRQYLTALTASCGSECHAAYIDPLGFSFEAFDGMGQERTTDNGQPIDTTGSYPFSDGEKSFADAKELMQILAESPQAHACYAKKLSSYALQRDIVEADQPLLDDLAGVSSAEDSLKEVIVSLLRDPAFRVRAEGTP